MSLRLRREVLGGIINFVREGTMIDVEGVPTPVGPNVKPTAASGLYDSLGCTMSIVPDTNTTTDPVTCFNPISAKWEQTENESVLADYLDIQVSEHNTLIWEMIFGIDGAIPEDGVTPVIPFGSNSRVIRGWFQQQARSAEDNVNRVVFDIYVEMRVQAYPGFTEQSVKPTLRFEVKASPLNTALFQADL